MLRFGKIKLAKEDFYGEKKENVAVDDIVLLKLTEKNNNCKYLMN